VAPSRNIAQTLKTAREKFPTRTALNTAISGGRNLPPMDHKNVYQWNRCVTALSGESTRIKSDLNSMLRDIGGESMSVAQGKSGRP
jgi:hypothetical protein